MTAFLTFQPVRDGYTFEPGYSCIEVQLDGGASRKRQDVLYQPHIITVNWVLTGPEYTQFMGFFRTTVNNGTSPFLMFLVSDLSTPTLHKCKTKGGIPKLTQQKGLAYFVTSTLEVEQNPTYTGNIIYQEPDLVVFSTTNPFFVGPIVTGDTIWIQNAAGTHPTGPTFLDMQGVYSVTSTTGFDTLQLNSPASVNSNWTILATLGAPGQFGDVSHGNVISTITKFPT